MAAPEAWRRRGKTRYICIAYLRRVWGKTLVAESKIEEDFAEDSTAKTVFWGFGPDAAEGIVAGRPVTDCVTMWSLTAYPF